MPKSKLGRPSRSKEGRAEQITVRLRPSALFAMELVARDRRISVAQAIEFSALTVAQGYLLDGTSVAEYARKMANLNDRAHVKEILQKEQLAVDSDDDAEKIVDFIRAAGLAKILLMPTRLRRTDEAYLLEAWRLVRVHNIAPNEFTEFIHSCYERGVSASEASLLWSEMKQEKS